jgi:hypothetical protein
MQQTRLPGSGTTGTTGDGGQLSWSQLFLLHSTRVRQHPALKQFNWEHCLSPLFASLTQSNPGVHVPRADRKSKVSLEIFSQAPASSIQPYTCGNLYVAELLNWRVQKLTLKPRPYWYSREENRAALRGIETPRGKIRD